MCCSLLFTEFYPIAGEWQVFPTHYYDLTYFHGDISTQSSWFYYETYEKGNPVKASRRSPWPFLLLDIIRYWLPFFYPVSDKKYHMSICLVFLPHEYFPFFSWVWRSDYLGRWHCTLPYIPLLPMIAWSAKYRTCGCQCQLYRLPLNSGCWYFLTQFDLNGSLTQLYHSSGVNFDVQVNSIGCIDPPTHSNGLVCLKY